MRHLPAVLRVIVAVGIYIVPAFAGTETAERGAGNELRALHSGNGLLNRGMYDLAIEEYRDFLTEHAGHAKAPVARYGMAVCMFRLGRDEEAATQLERLNALDDFAYAAEVATILGQCRLSQQQYGAARDAFEKVVRQHRKHDLADDAGAGWVEALYRDGQYHEAIKRCRKFVSRWPDSSLRERVAYFGGLAEMATEKYKAAAKRFTAMLEANSGGQFADRITLLVAQCQHNTGALDEAVRYYRRVLKRVSGEGVQDALLGLATILQQRGQAEEASRLLDRLLGEFPQGGLGSSAKLRRARIWFDEQQFDRALELFREAGAGDAGLADRADYWMAKCLLRKGDFAEAAEGLARAIKRHPDSELLAEMYYDRGVALVRAGEAEAAISALEAFLDRFENHGMAPDALHLLATTEHQLKRYEQSQKHCLRFAQRFASHGQSATVAFLSAENEFLLRRYEQAVRLFEEFLKDHPDAAEASKARFRLGTAMYRLGKFDEAETLLTRSVDELGTGDGFASSLLALGDIQFERGAWEATAGNLEAYLASGSTASTDDALLKLGLARQRQEHYEPALEAYDALLSEHDDSPHRMQAMFERGQSLLALGRSADAATAFEKVLVGGGDSRFASFARKHLGAIAVNNRDFDAAAEYFDQAASMTGSDGDADALFHRGQALMGGQHFERAEKVFEAFLGRYGSHTRAGRARAQLAIALSRQDRYQEALKVIAKLDGELDASVQYERAWCYRKLGKAKEAADAYRALLTSHGDHASAVHATLDLAAIEADAGRYESAAQLLRRLNDGDREVPAAVNEQAVYRLAVCEYELGRFAGAAELFEKFLSEFPGSALVASASFFCGESLFGADRHERAVAHFARVVERFSSEETYPASLLRLGECHAVLQRWAKSERAFVTYLDRFADRERWFQAMFGVGWARENQRRYHDAIGSYREVVERHRGVTAARAQFQIGECLFAKKQYSGAVRELLKVDIHYAYPEWSAGALFEAGRCFEKLGKLVEARAQFREVVEKYAQTRWARMAGERLQVVSAGGLPGR